MRWKHKKSNIKMGDKRTISKFLLYPITINNETRWLEYVKYEEQYGAIVYYGAIVPSIKHKCSWIKTKWVGADEKT